MDENLHTLVCHINEEVVRGGFTRLEPTPSASEIEIAAAWKQKTWGHVWGVAAVSLGRFTNHPGDFAHCVKRRVARAIGYSFLFHRVTLHLVIVGRGVLGRSEELQIYMEPSAGQFSLPNIHVVDLDARAALGHYPDDEGVHEEIVQPLNRARCRQPAYCSAPPRVTSARCPFGCSWPTRAAQAVPRAP
jgi:hypothetical protein